MKIETYLFGTIDVSDDSVITFPDGLPAFEHCRRFALVHEREASSTPTSYTLQSLDDPSVAFQIADPTVYGFHYELELTDDETSKLAVASPDQVTVMLMLFRRDDRNGPIEANLRAPVLINTATRLAMQKLIVGTHSNQPLSKLAATV
jgi:flagellar assembly factor FliW